jgi:DNA repair protein RadC
MRRKFFDYGDEIFDTYELLEMLLYTVIPVTDTNPLAKRLLAVFGGLDGVLSAT